MKQPDEPVHEPSGGLPPIEGSPFGPDKVAHFLLAPAITGWACALHPDWALIWWLGAILLGAVWELSNHRWVIKGETGISVLDMLAFLAGDAVAGLLLLAWRA